jgi:hypothetical protein
MLEHDATGERELVSVRCTFGFRWYFRCPQRTVMLYAGRRGWPAGAATGWATAAGRGGRRHPSGSGGSTGGDHSAAPRATSSCSPSWSAPWHRRLRISSTGSSANSGEDWTMSEKNAMKERYKLHPSQGAPRGPDSSRHLAAAGHACRSRRPALPPFLPDGRGGCPQPSDSPLRAFPDGVQHSVVPRGIRVALLSGLAAPRKTDL